MAKIKIKYEFGGKGNYIIIEIEESSHKQIEEIKKNNREIWKEEYLRRQYLSKITLDQMLEEKGFEYPDETSNPFDKLLEEEKEEQFNNGLKLLGQALATLTDKQRHVFEEVVVKNKTITQISKELSLDHKTVSQHYQYALKKLRKFYRKYPQICEFFPDIMKD